MNAEKPAIDTHRSDDPVWRFADSLGPDQILHIHKAEVGLKAIVVVDNVAMGPSIGGVRMAPDVSLEECFRLSRAMTLKNSAAGLRHGGGKAVVFADPRMTSNQKETLLRAFAYAIRDMRDYIPGPDMGTNEQCMGWVWDEIGRAVGLPPEIGGIPLDEIGATGFGLAASAGVAEEYCDVRVAGARVAVQGFGSVGTHAARYLGERGAVLVAAADSRGAIWNPKGIDVEALTEHKRSGAGAADYSAGEPLATEAFIGVDCDIWIPAARPDVITLGNVDQIKARLIIEGANIPASRQAEEALAERGVLVIPDFIANAGGVICAAVEYAGGTRQSAFQSIEEKITANTQAVLDAAKTQGIAPRDAATLLARERVVSAMRLRRWR